MIAAALSHRRTFRVQHRAPDFTADDYGVDLRAVWLPDGCDVTTEIRANWSTRATGNYRLTSTLARGYRHDWHRVTGTRVMQLLTGTRCFWRD